MSQAGGSVKEWNEILTDLTMDSLPDIRRLIIVASLSAIVWVFFSRILVPWSPAIVSTIVGIAIVLSTFLRLPSYRQAFSTLKRILQQDNQFPGDPLFELLCLASQTCKAILDTVSLTVFGLLWFHFWLWYYLALTIACLLIVTIIAVLVIRFRLLSVRPLLVLTLKVCVLPYSLLESAPKTEPPPYQYKDLSEDKLQIRLIVCSRSSFFSKAKYSLETVYLEDAPEYDAISYTWGGERFDRYVIVDGKRLAITRNAKCILEERASSFRTTRLWIDAISINQLDKGEKNHQVTIMGQIYAQARRTLIWMNNEGVTPFQAIRVLVIFKIMRILKEDFAEDKELINMVCYNMLDPFWWNCLQTFIGHSYWTRVWIIQEISRGKRVHLLYGGFTLDWQYVNASLKLLMYPPLLGPLSRNSLVRNGLKASTEKSWINEIPAITRLDIMRILRSNKPLEPVLALHISAESLAGTDQDKIFALRSMVVDDQDTSSELAKVMQPDYERPCADVFIRLASYLLKPECNPNYIFETAGTGLERASLEKPPIWLEDLPTWVPDWAYTRHVAEEEPHKRSSKVHARPERYIKSKIIDYRAGGDGVFEFKLIGVRGLLLSGIKVSTISDLSESWNLTGEEEHPPFTEFHQSCNKLCKERIDEHYHWSGQPRSEAFWRTIIGDKVRETPVTKYSFPAPADWAQEYQTWLSSPLGPDGDFRDLVREQSTGTFEIQFIVACSGMRFAVTDDKQMALVPTGAQVGDMIYVIPGIRRPLLFRLRDSNALESNIEKANEVDFVGRCYVHGIMEGQWLSQNLRKEKLLVF